MKNRGLIIKEEKLNVLLMYLGQFITMFGTQIFTYGVSFYVLKTTGSALAFGVSLGLGSIPKAIISPFAGVITDRFDRKKSFGEQTLSVVYCF